MTLSELRNIVEWKERDALKVDLWHGKCEKFDIINVDHLCKKISKIYLIPKEDGEFYIPIKEFENQISNINSEIEFANSFEDAINDNGAPLDVVVYTNVSKDGLIEKYLTFKTNK